MTNFTLNPNSSQYPTYYSRLIREHYGFHGNQIIYNINDVNMEFDIVLGESIVTLPFPKRLSRELKIKKILR